MPFPFCVLVSLEIFYKDNSVCAYARMYTRGCVHVLVRVRAFGCACVHVGTYTYMQRLEEDARHPTLSSPAFFP